MSEQSGQSSGEPMRIEVEVSPEYLPTVEEQLTGLLPLLKQEKVSLPPIKDLRGDSATVAIIVAIIGAVGPTVTKEVFAMVRRIVKDLRDRKKKVTAEIRHNNTTQIIETGDEQYEIQTRA